MTEVPMPRLSDSMEEGTIIRWLASEGASIERGQELVEIETDKASMTYEADGTGTLHILAAEGDTLPVGVAIAELLAAGESPQSSPASSGAQPEPQPPSTTEPAPADIEAPTTEHPSAQDAEQSERIKASPLARRMADTQGVDLSQLSGSGPGGRIVRADVESASETSTAATPAVSQSKGETRVLELSRTQALIARRMAEAKATIPEFTLQRIVDMRHAVDLRRQLKESSVLDGRPVPSFNDLVIRACALALGEHPLANGTYKDGRFELHGRINIGMAVAAQDALLVPVVHDANERSIWEITERTSSLAARAREGTITPPELAGATFSVSNLGMFGVDSFTAIIAPGQSAILAVGAVREQPVVRDGQLQAGHDMGLTLTCDHRILYGAQAAQFLDAVCVRLERPLSLLS